MCTGVRVYVQQFDIILDFETIKCCKRSHALLRNIRLTAVQIGTRFAVIDQLLPHWAIHLPLSESVPHPMREFEIFIQLVCNSCGRSGHFQETNGLTYIYDLLSCGRYKFEYIATCIQTR